MPVANSGQMSCDVPAAIISTDERFAAVAYLFRGILNERFWHCLECIFLRRASSFRAVSKLVFPPAGERNAAGGTKYHNA